MWHDVVGSTLAYTADEAIEAQVIRLYRVTCAPSGIWRGGLTALSMYLCDRGLTRSIKLSQLSQMPRPRCSCPG